MRQLLYANGESLIGALLLDGDHDSFIVSDRVFAFAPFNTFRSIWAVKVAYDYTSRPFEWTWRHNLNVYSFKMAADGSPFP
jgi:hypothetical protein